jgi:nucleotidyltransferase/DNA polymerase involved in DNA repair
MRRVLYLWVPHLQTTRERQETPSLCDRPLLVVGGRPALGSRLSALGPAKAGSVPAKSREPRAESRLVLDASPEAEAQGVTAGMPARQAQRRCPDALCLHRERAHYESISLMIGDTLAEHTPWVERLLAPSGRRLALGARRLAGTGPGFAGPSAKRQAPSAAFPAQDEFFADLGAGDAKEGLEIARRVSRRLGADLGLETRIALATSRFVARVACRSAETDLVLVPEGTERRSLRAVGIEALWEATPEARRRMQLLGLRALGQLAAVPPRWLIEQFGPVGRCYGLLARGVDPRGVRTWDPAPSVTASCELPAAEADAALMEACLCRLAGRIAARLVREGKYGRTVTLTLTLEDGRRLLATRSLKEPTNLARTLIRTGRALLAALQRKAQGATHNAGNAAERPATTGAVRLAPCALCLARSTMLTLAVTDLGSHGALQLSIFGDGERGLALRAAVARIQERFGETAIVPLSSHG